ncbi:MAG: acetyl/propionyl/methylcrotonyl-CoA carboxylase subunit alpha [Silicimonas sp.]|nr:acetyl/propionyl/methylcrotonyl-CoA carboxylase subunit alpha [Silicimonas sp.]
MFTKILIANRGEIACRVIRTARRMGVKTVAVYSDADRAALHVEMADEAVHIGASEVSQSYLKGARIIEAALQTGAQAIHPGYGFLSENPEFVEAVEKAGLTFIGPSAASIRAMGLKDAAKALMEEAGVPVVPGYHGADQDPAFLKSQADVIGYPVLIKARAGGGGKGMRLVERPEDFAANLESAAREGQNAFDDPAVLIEKFITSPRHIEVQVFGDKHGNVVHLYERDCSLQRRHQKVIEEAPAPGMTAEVRAAMTDAAVTAAKAIEYFGAGTIEFIVDGAGDLRKDGFWFMEMNTRLQVEHPVTEAITGTDLVEWQLRVAAGERLPLAQKAIPLQGHAFEARLYAEDAAKDFLPATGKIDHISFGQGRIDTGVRTGNEISPFYDPMIAKITTHGASRAEALVSLQNALVDVHVVGPVTNVAFLGALARHKEFSHGNADTGLIARDFENLVARPAHNTLSMAIGALLLSGIDTDDPFTGWRLWGTATHLVVLQRDGEDIDAFLTPFAKAMSIKVGAEQVDLTDIELTENQISAFRDGQAFCAKVFRSETRIGAKASVNLQGQTQLYTRKNPLEVATLVVGSGDDVAAPMTGMVRSVIVKAGAAVARGDALIVLEAMKMEHTLRAPRDGDVAEVTCDVGDQVSDGAVLLRLKADADG